MSITIVSILLLTFVATQLFYLTLLSIPTLIIALSLLLLNVLIIQAGLHRTIHVTGSIIQKLDTSLLENPLDHVLGEAQPLTSQQAQPLTSQQAKPLEPTLTQTKNHGEHDERSNHEPHGQSSLLGDTGITYS